MDAEKIWVQLPNRDQSSIFPDHLVDESMIHENMKFIFAGFLSTARSMAILLAMINANGCFEPFGEFLDQKQFKAPAKKNSSALEM